MSLTYEKKSLNLKFDDCKCLATVQWDQLLDPLVKQIAANELQIIYWSDNWLLYFQVFLFISLNN